MRISLPRPARLWHDLRAALAARRATKQRQARARYLASLMLAELGRMHDLRYRVSRGKEKDRIIRVSFAPPLLLTREELYCPIMTSRLPPNVKTSDLDKPEVLQSLSDRVGTTVRLVRLPTGQVCYATRLAGSTFPVSFPINSYKLPEDAPGLAIPLGIDGEGQHGWADLTKLPHLLVIGPTGKGKSNLIHAMLTRWIERNSTDDLELWLADHKGGAELNRYRALMPKRAGQRGIVQRFSYKPDETIEFLSLAQREMKRRLELLRQQDASDLDDYARVSGQSMRRIVVVIDEIVNLMLNKEKIDRYTIGKYAESLLVEIASQGRAAGVHLVISTQVIKSDVLTSLIKANFESRIAFGVADHWQSLTAIDDSRAAGLPLGRIIFKREGQYAEYQSPRITPQQVRMLIDRIAKYGPEGGLGEADEARRLRDDAALLVKVAVEYFEGRLARSAMLAHPQVKGVITRDRFDEVCKRLERDGVLTASKSKNPRRVAPLIHKNPDIIYSMYGPERSDMRDKPANPAAAHTNPTESRNDCGRDVDQVIIRLQEATEAVNILRDMRDMRDAGGTEGPPSARNPENGEPDPPPPGWWGTIEE